jgi:6-phosphogluconolactonase/glucosamine-6-phosphate isomerase/deaminase
MIEMLLDAAVPWESVTVWQVDERVAPVGHAARNSNQLANLACQVELMPVTARDLRAAARRYAASLPDRFDVIHLGLGDDGHTASWPPGNEALLRSQRSVELVPEFNGWRRMTLTKRVVNVARSRVVLAVGSSKRTMVERWLLDDRRLPISAIRRTDTVVFLDHAAGPAAPVDSGG